MKKKEQPPMGEPTGEHLVSINHDTGDRLYETFYSRADAIRDGRSMTFMDIHGKMRTTNKA